MNTIQDALERNRIEEWDSVYAIINDSSRKVITIMVFQIKENKSTIKIEIIAGITTFLSMMYIIIVNPSILSKTGMPFSGVLTATILVSAFSSIMMGLYAKNPIVLAPGMGINSFFTFSVVIGMNERWETALGAVFWSGVVFLLLSVFNIRTAIVKAIPKPLKEAIAVGIGLFIAFTGFTEAGFIVSNPDTVVGIGSLDATTVVFLIGLLVTAVMVVKQIKGGLIIGIVITTLLAIPLGRFYGQTEIVQWKGVLAAPDFSLLFSLDLLGSLKLSLIPTMFALLFVDLFDSLSTFIGIAEASGLKDADGEPRNLKKSLIVDAISTLISGLCGTSSGSSYIESATGIAAGGRTGLTAVVAGVLFLPFMFFSPLLSVVPSIATAPVLIIVGIFMITPVLNINWNKYDDAIPAFLSIILIPMTYSITQGIIWGFLSWTAIKLLTGKKNEVSPMLILVDFLAILELILNT